MKALVFRGKEQIEYETIKDPSLETASDCIIKVEIAGLCGSDLHVYHEREKGLDHGTAMGHEFVGTIIEKGKGVSNFEIGDRVFSPFTTNCGTCYYCKVGLTSRCEIGQFFGWKADGIGLHGGQAEYVRVPLANSTLKRIPKELNPEAALLSGDIFSTGYFGVEKLHIQAEGQYGIVGCGPVGLMAIAAAIALGAKTVFAIDLLPERLAKATDLGAIPILLNDPESEEKIQVATKGRGLDGVLEAVGLQGALETAIQLIRPGGFLSSVGAHTCKHFPFSPIQAYDKNLTFSIGRCPARHYMETLLPLLLKIQDQLLPIISHRFPLAQGPNAYRIFDKKEDDCTKVIFHPNL